MVVRGRPLNPDKVKQEAQDSRATAFDDVLSSLTISGFVPAEADEDVIVFARTVS